MKLIETKLPEWAWVAGGTHDPDSANLNNRHVVLHIRSASVIEFFEYNSFFPSENTKCYTFDYINKVGIVERFIAVLHFSAIYTPDDLLIKASEWFKRYLSWEDENIINDSIAQQN